MGDCAVQNRIRRLRFDQGEMTQQALADRIGVTRQTNALSNAFGQILGAQPRQEGELAIRVTW